MSYDLNSSYDLMLHPFFDFIFTLVKIFVESIKTRIPLCRLPLTLAACPSLLLPPLTPIVFVLICFAHPVASFFWLKVNL
jgi:hypothetical protein